MSDFGGRIDRMIEQRKLDDAAPLCRKAIQAEPAVADHRCRMALTELLRGHWDAAIRSADAAIAIDPRCEWAYRLRAKALLAKGWKHDALFSARIAAGLRPDERMSQETLVDVLLEHDMLDAAAAAADRAVELGPDCVTALKRRARVHARRRELDDAERDARRALEIDPGHSPAAAILGEVEAARHASNARRAGRLRMGGASAAALGVAVVYSSKAGMRSGIDGAAGGGLDSAWWEYALLAVVACLVVGVMVVPIIRFVVPAAMHRLDPLVRRAAVRRAMRLPHEVHSLAGLDRR
ncbi:MAG TPA: tetratricopeptide repeat protein [Acidimicrobiia bacterium]